MSFSKLDFKGDLDDKRGDCDGNVEDKMVEGDFNCEEKVGDDLEDKRGDREDKGVDAEGELFKHTSLVLCPKPVLLKY